MIQRFSPIKSSITIHDPFTYEEFAKTTGLSLKDSQQILEFIFEGPAHGGMIQLLNMNIYWTEPDHTGHTPITIEKF